MNTAPAPIGAHTTCPQCGSANVASHFSPDQTAVWLIVIILAGIVTCGIGLLLIPAAFFAGPKLRYRHCNQCGLDWVPKAKPMHPTAVKIIVVIGAALVIAYLVAMAVSLFSGN